MNRVIKFRAWDKNESIMHDVIVMQRDEFVAVPEVGSNGWELSKRKLADVELMQFTGLTNNGQEWYESDILECDSDWYVINWSQDQAMWEAVGVNGTHIVLALSELLGQETWVQGNVFENPNLLTTTHTEKEV